MKFSAITGLQGQREGAQKRILGTIPKQQSIVAVPRQTTYLNCMKIHSVLLEMLQKSLTEVISVTVNKSQVLVLSLT